jgi:hypothetical protein
MTICRPLNSNSETDIASDPHTYPIAHSFPHADSCSDCHSDARTHHDGWAAGPWNCVQQHSD